MKAAVPVLLTASLVACSPAPAPEPTSDSRPAATRTRNPLRPSEAQLDAFVNAFRFQYPELSDGHTDRFIGHDADNTCADVIHDVEQPVLLRRVAFRFARNGLTPNRKTSAAILKLIKAKACPGA